jgi:hypothetical protein
MFNLYINDLALYLKSVNIGVDCDGDKVCILLYADDIVLLAENEQDLQILLNALNEWCILNQMDVNAKKSNIIHFRKQSVSQSEFIFHCGNQLLTYVDKYTYLGVPLTEYLDFDIMAKTAAQSASRALGLIIAKSKCVGGFSFDVYTKLYDTMVRPIINYSAGIWGFKSYSCINAVQNRAMRFFLGVGKYTPTAALFGETGWIPPLADQWTCISRQYARLSRLNIQRLNKRISYWVLSKASEKCKNWFFKIDTFLNDHDIHENFNTPISPGFVKIVQNKAMLDFISDWRRHVNSLVGPSGRGRNKLRTYCTFKTEFKTENYCKIILPIRHRTAFAKFRCGVAPLRLETGRYEGLAIEDRLCPFCNMVETESHVLLNCDIYDDFRNELFHKAVNILPRFNNLTNQEKIEFIFTNFGMIRISAKTCFNILQRRASLLCK